MLFKRGSILLVFLLILWTSLADQCQPDEVRDDCGICNGNNVNMDPAGVCCPIDEKDCSGFCFGLLELDDCGVCGGSNEKKDINGTCCEVHDQDCNRICYGPAVPDACGVCGGDGSGMDTTGICCDENQRDCKGTCFGTAVNDKCGVCDGDDTTCCGPEGSCTNGNGICSEIFSSCECDLPYTGQYCQHERDICRFKDCGEHGTCVQSHDEETYAVTVKCECHDGWSGENCNLFHCNKRGGMDDETGVCHCLSPYDPDSDCSTCTEVEGDNKRICVHGEGTGHYRAVEIPKAAFNRVIASGRYLVAGEWRKVFLPDTVFEGVAYDCGCRKKSPEKLREEEENQKQGATRFTQAGAEASLNQLLIEMVSAATTSDSDLEKITKRTLEDQKRGEVAPVLILFVIFILLAAAFAIVMALVAFCLIPRWRAASEEKGVAWTKPVTSRTLFTRPTSTHGSYY